MLDNVPHIKAYWIMLGEKVAQIALAFGADDLDGTIFDERITRAAGGSAGAGIRRERLEHLIRQEADACDSDIETMKRTFNCSHKAMKYRLNVIR